MTLLTLLAVLAMLSIPLWFAFKRPAAPKSGSVALHDLGELSPAEYQDVHVNPWIWTAMRVGGGGVFKTPELARADAIEYVTRCGSHQLCAVDDVHKIIFYRSL